jgi:transcriptional regulator with XRE-family HTH domain
MPGDLTDISSRIADVMIERRNILNISLQEVADRAGLTKSHIWDLEAGHARNPTLRAMIGISKALGVSLDYLTGLSNTVPDIHPEAMRIALEVDALLRAKRRTEKGAPHG